MKTKWRRRSIRATGVLAVSIAMALSGCAVSRAQFNREKHSLRDDEVCRASLAARKATDFDYQDEIGEELMRRGIPFESCSSIVATADRRAAAAFVGVLAAATVVAAARHQGSGGGAYYGGAPHDYDWAWDQFYDQHGNLVWACRGRQSGQFSHLDQCRFKLKADNTWPSKRAWGR
ncbi:hypothetical protein [Hydrogenophaga sp. 5NK40-0174]|uniref:hypothetical protein n=1 Tax=Hydrogenophaga sp. 5NK40-0174 TaxID=3127649 RepID=UPI0031067383